MRRRFDVLVVFGYPIGSLHLCIVMRHDFDKRMIFL